MKATSIVSILIVVLAMTLPIEASANPQLQEQTVLTLDEIAATPVKKGLTVGLVAIVSKDGEVVYEGAKGMANAEWEVPMTVDAMFEVGSIAKQIIAVAILQLRDNSKLDLADDIYKWVPELGGGESGITLRHLLSHTSGIYRFDDTPEWKRNTFLPGVGRTSALELISISPTQFEAGEAQAYSNSGYWLLGLVVERASGQPLEQYLKDKIFEPLGMNRSIYCDSYADVDRRAHGYMIRSGKLRRVPTVAYEWVFAPGAVCSSAEDLIRWMKALHGGKVLTEDAYQEMTTAATLNDGTQLQYGMGIKVGTTLDGWSVVGHGGSAPGFRADATWYPDKNISVVVLMNSAGSGRSASSVSSALATAVSGVAKPPPTFYTGDPSLYEGVYELLAGGNQEGLVIEVSGTEQGLAFSLNGSPPRPLPWAGNHTFYGGDLTTFRFVFDDGLKSHASQLRRDNAGNHFIFERQ